MTEALNENDWSIDVPWRDFRVEADTNVSRSVQEVSLRGCRLSVAPDGVVSVRDFGDAGATARMESGELACFLESEPEAVRWMSGNEYALAGRCWWRNDSTEPAAVWISGVAAAGS
ncbi:hypothetical protein [Demetria terragena]|uniref:hypothetical protein n=1 Tax=Demetria terragena TaxID=63959 RepID=UPI00035F3283|nr:hypothetical protein [Demetria terragena]